MWIIRFLSNLDLNFLLNFLAFFLIISISNKMTVVVIIC